MDILNNALADCKSEYVYRDERIILTPCKRIAAGTPILTGTPEGVIFRISNLWSLWAYPSAADEAASFGTYLGFTKNVIQEHEE